MPESPIIRANREFVASIKKIAADVGVVLTEADIAKMQMKAGAERRPFGDVMRDLLEQRLTEVANIH